MAYVNFKEVGDYYVDTFGGNDTNPGTATAPFFRITKAIDAVGTSSGKTIVIGGGGLIQEDCTKLSSGTARSTSNSNAITFVFDGYAVTDCSQTTYFKICGVTGIADSVSNMWWANGSSKVIASNYAVGILYNCVLHNIYLQSGVLNASYAAKNTVFTGCSAGASASTTITADNCVFYKNKLSDAVVHKYVAKNCYFSLNSTGGLNGAITTNNGGNTCESGAISGATVVGDPQFISPEDLIFRVLPTSPLIGGGAEDILTKLKADSGLGGTTNQYNGLSTIFSKSSGAVYSQTGGIDDVEVLPSGMFALIVSSFYGTVTSAVIDGGKIVKIKRLGSRMATTYTGKHPDCMPDFLRAEHLAAASATAPDTTSIVLATRASSTNDYYNGMRLKINSGAGTAGYYEITDYDGATKVATLATSTGTLTDATTNYELIETYCKRYDFQMRFADDLTALNSAPWLSMEWDSDLGYSITGGIKYGNADPNYIPASKVDIVCRMRQYRIALSRY